MIPDEASLSTLQKIQVFGLLPVVLPIVVAINELGHLITGLLQGFRFQMYVVRPLGIKRDERSERIVGYINKDLNLIGGLAKI